MDKNAKNSETKASKSVQNSTWSPHMDGIPEPSAAEQAMMDARSASYESRRFKAFQFQEISPTSKNEVQGSNDRQSRKQKKTYFVYLFNMNRNFSISICFCFFRFHIHAKANLINPKEKRCNNYVKNTPHPCNSPKSVL